MMSVPANLYPGLNDIVDVLDEIPAETSRYLTLLHEIDAKCVNSMPTLNNQIGDFLGPKNVGGAGKFDLLLNINRLFEELMPSLEEKMHVSSIMLESLQKLSTRLELAYEVAIKNQEIPAKLRLGVDNHPAMHLHYELMEKIDGKSVNGANGAGNKTSQALRSESRREAMVANKKQQADDSAPQYAAPSYGTQADSFKTHDQQQQRQSELPAPQDAESSRKRVSPPTIGSSVDPKKRKRRANVKTIVGDPANSPTTSSTSAVDAATVSAATAAAVVPAVPATAAVHLQQAHAHTHDGTKPRTNEYGEPLYCYCNQVAYGEMVGCDGDSCELEWFHLPCINLDHLPKGKWYCDECKKKL